MLRREAHMLKLEGKTVVRVTTYQGGAMRKHGSWRQELVDAERVLLDKIAAHRASPMGNHGLVIRRKAKI